MDHPFAVRVLTEFASGVSQYLLDLELTKESFRWPDPPQELELQEVRARLIENAYVPGLGDYEMPGNMRGNWEVARYAAIQALGRAQSAEEITAFLRPSAPAIAADALHAWVWEPAAPLWAADSHQDAVLAAARTVNRRLQKKLGRHDIGEYDLAVQSFDLKDPVQGKPRLRLPGDRSTPTWRARQEGAKFVAAGAFLAIRNVAAHEEITDWGQQEALEYLATLSVVARWIDECTVESVASSTTSQSQPSPVGP